MFAEGLLFERSVLRDGFLFKCIEFGLCVLEKISEEIIAAQMRRGNES